MSVSEQNTFVEKPQKTSLGFDLVVGGRWLPDLRTLPPTHAAQVVCPSPGAEPMGGVEKVSLPHCTFCHSGHSEVTLGLTFSTPLVPVAEFLAPHSLSQPWHRSEAGRHTDTRDAASASPACLISEPVSSLSPGSTGGFSLSAGEAEPDVRKGRQSSHPSRSAAPGKAAQKAQGQGWNPQDLQRIHGAKILRRAFVHAFIHPTNVAPGPTILPVLIEQGSQTPKGVNKPLITCRP